MSTFITGKDISKMEKIWNRILKTHNFLYKIKVSLLHFKYNNIKSIEYHSFETVEFIKEDMLIDRKNLPLIEFKGIIQVLEQNNILKWDRHYFATYEYMDGGDWKIKIKFKNNLCFKTSGDIEAPKEFNNVYKCFEKYIKTTGDI